MIFHVNILLVLVILPLLIIPAYAEPQITIGQPYFDNSAWKLPINGTGFYPDLNITMVGEDSRDWGSFNKLIDFWDDSDTNISGDFSIEITIRNDYVQSGYYDITITDIQEHIFLDNHIQFNDFDDDFITWEFSTTEFKVNEEKIFDITGHVDRVPEYDDTTWNSISLHIFENNTNSFQLATGYWNLQDTLDDNGDFHIADIVLFSQTGTYQPVFMYDVATIFTPTITVTSSDPVQLEPQFPLLLNDIHQNTLSLQIYKWEEQQNKTNTDLDSTILKWQEATHNNSTIQIAIHNATIGDLMALNEVYENLIDTLQYQISLYS